MDSSKTCPNKLSIKLFFYNLKNWKNSNLHFFVFNFCIEKSVFRRLTVADITLALTSLYFFILEDSVFFKFKKKPYFYQN